MESKSNLLNYLSSQSYDVKLILSEFADDIMNNKFYINKEYLIENSIYVKFDIDKWKYRPNIFCNDYYQEQYFYPVILLVNNITTMFNFVPDSFLNQLIIAPNKNAIIKLISN